MKTTIKWGLLDKETDTLVENPITGSPTLYDSRGEVERRMKDNKIIQPILMGVVIFFVIFVGYMTTDMFADLIFDVDIELDITYVQYVGVILGLVGVVIQYMKVSKQVEEDLNLIVQVEIREVKRKK